MGTHTHSSEHYACKPEDRTKEFQGSCRSRPTEEKEKADLEDDAVICTTSMHLAFIGLGMHVLKKKMHNITSGCILL